MSTCGMPAQLSLAWSCLIMTLFVASKPDMAHRCSATLQDLPSKTTL